MGWSLTTRHHSCSYSSLPHHASTWKNPLSIMNHHQLPFFPQTMVSNHLDDSSFAIIGYHWHHNHQNNIEQPPFNHHLATKMGYPPGLAETKTTTPGSFPTAPRLGAVHGSTRQAQDATAVGHPRCGHFSLGNHQRTLTCNNWTHLDLSGINWPSCFFHVFSIERS